MKKSNVTTNVIVIAVVGIFGFCGCGPQKPEATGFLSDYSKLQADSDVSLCN